MANRLLKTVSAIGAVIAFSSGAAYADKWDMPMAYSATNFHSAVGAEFAKCITTGTGGDIEVVTHPGGSLFKGADIKRAIQTGQVPLALWLFLLVLREYGECRRV
jgi:TRAP-type C4-dicarboxylate transport system substrate-binding protein